MIMPIVHRIHWKTGGKTVMFHGPWPRTRGRVSMCGRSSGGMRSTQKKGVPDRWHLYRVMDG